MDSRKWLLYGAYGFTGTLTARLAVERGLKPILAGRDAAKVQRLATELNLDHRVFGLDTPADVDAGLDGMYAVMHMAGPYAFTSAQMAAGCLRKGVHYMDITGEIGVFEALEAMDEAARTANVMLMPGCGFDIVPTDCLALALKAQMPDAVSLDLAVIPPGNVRPTKGTTLSILGQHDGTARERLDGVMVTRPIAGEQLDVVIPNRGRLHIVQAPVADAVAAYHSTGIRNIRTFFLMGAVRYGMLLLHVPGVKWLVTSLVTRFWKDPTPEQMAGTTMDLWGRVRNARGDVLEASTRTADGYVYTADVAVAIVQRVLGGTWQPGYRSPAEVFGASIAEERPSFVPYEFVATPAPAAAPVASPTAAAAPVAAAPAAAPAAEGEASS